VGLRRPGGVRGGAVYRSDPGPGGRGAARWRQCGLRRRPGPVRCVTRLRRTARARWVAEAGV